jgi:D-glycero-D-manno-heptose 1,7-bisphosphate phosphatase
MKLIILDRDGVINHDSSDYIKSPDEWKPIPGSLEAIARLNRAGFRVVVATNQAGIERGLFVRAALDGIHDKMRAALAQVGGHIDSIFVCPHKPESDCDCRKPRPGLFDQISRHYGVGLGGVPAIGDMLRDLQAAAAVGAQPILVSTGNGERTRREGALPSNTLWFKDLAEAADFVIN